jgi:glucose/arabinose dehydrogenase
MKRPTPALTDPRQFAVLLCLLMLGGCYPMLPSSGGGQADFDPPREADPLDFELPDGYVAEVVATGLNLPTSVAFDGQGRVYVLEAGYSYGELFSEPRLLRLHEDRPPSVLAAGNNPPWNGVDYSDGSFFVAGGHVGGGEVLRIDSDGTMSTVVAGLPSFGDHHTNGPLAGPDGWIYFGQGTATNSAVVGTDNYDIGWLPRNPDFHDVPCEDVVLLGRDYATPNPLTEDPDDSVSTGAYVPFGTPTEAGQVVPGEVPCSGAIMRVRPDGSDLQVMAWGLRNPFGLAWAADGSLLVSENSFDERGSRPVFGTGDLLWRIEPGTWYGWPDYWSGRPLTQGEWFSPSGEAEAPGFLLAEHPAAPPEPLAFLGVHSSSNGLDVSRSAEFGFVGDVFIAQFGDMAPNVGKVLEPVGFKVIRVDGEGRIFDFAMNRGARNGPASKLDTGGLERPVSVRFGPDGESLYIVDFGVMTISDGVVQPRLGTGVLWRVTHEGGR